MSRMGNRFQTYFDITKFEKTDEGTLLIKGVASSESKDEDGETILASAVKNAIPDYMKFGAVREMHGDIAAGSALSIEVDEDGFTHLEAEIVDEGSMKKVLKGVLKGFSLGGKKTKRNAENRKIIEEIKLTEISLVDRPCNPDAVFELAKFADDSTDEEGGGDVSLPKETPAATAPEDLKKGIWDVKTFADVLQSIGWLASGAASESMWEGDASPVPAQLKKWLAEGAVIFKAMADEEIKELLDGLKVGEELALASGVDDLAKAGRKFSKATKAKLMEAHDHLNKAADCMKSSGYDADEDDAKKAAEADDLQKAAGLTEEISTLRTENEDLQKASGLLNQELEDLRKASATLTEEHEALKKVSDEAATLLETLLAKRKGSIRVVDKKDDLGTNDDAPEDLTKRAPTTEAEAMEAARSLTARTMRGES